MSSFLFFIKKRRYCSVGKFFKSKLFVSKFVITLKVANARNFNRIKPPLFHYLIYKKKRLYATFFFKQFQSFFTFIDLFSFCKMFAFDVYYNPFSIYKRKEVRIERCRFYFN